jgi:DNA-binding MarR family transcriptional regulator
VSEPSADAERAVPAADLEIAARDLMRMFAPPMTRTPLPARDLTFGQLRLLVLLHRQGPQPMRRIAEMFDLTSAGATGLVQRVERHGLVERRHRPDDRRVVECDLSAEGRRVVLQFAGLRLAELQRMLSVLEPDELATFHRLVLAITERGADR